MEGHGGVARPSRQCEPEHRGRARFASHSSDRLGRAKLPVRAAGNIRAFFEHDDVEARFGELFRDDRAAYVSRERFPQAQRLLVGDVGPTLAQLAKTDITESTFCLIVTRGHAHDEEALYHLAGTPAGYVGMIGSKRKIKLIYEDLRARAVPAAALEKVHAPLGFAIGSQTVPEIAVSIVAELIACRNLGHTIPEARIHVSV